MYKIAYNLKQLLITGLGKNLESWKNRNLRNIDKTWNF